MNAKLVVVLACIALLWVSGCGFKSPPLPPVDKGNILAAPADLTVEQTGQRVTLNWTHRPDPETARVTPLRFDIFKAIKAPGDCEGCPFVFKTAGIVNVPDMTFQTRVKTGVRTYFRIQAVGNHDVRSDYSKTVMVEAE